MISVQQIEQARRVIEGYAIRTPLVRLDVESDAEIWLKLELLQPVRSFKIRGAGNAVLSASDAQLANGVVTASAGNMAQGVAWTAKLRGVPATIVVPDHAPQTKIDAVERYGGHVIKVPVDEWWQVMIDGRYEDVDGLFVHPVDNDQVMAGNGTIGLELLEQSPDFDAVVTPWGGGGLFTGIATAVKAARPEVKFYVAEPETGAPVTASLAAGKPVEVEYTASFVDGSGGKALIPRVWELGSRFIEGSFALSLTEAAGAVRTLAERARVIAEGAGALPVAAVMSGRVAGARKIVCIVSGGNIDPAVLARILVGETP